MTNYRHYRYAVSVTSQFYFCGIPFRFDASPKCALNCLYCFAMSRGGRRTSNQLLASPDRIKRYIDRIFNKKDIKVGINGEFLKHKMPIHFGGISDPFSDVTVTRVSQTVLTHLAQFNYPIVISTKNTDELLKEDTFEILKKIKNLIIQISLTTSNDKLAREIEPNAPSPTERINSIRILSNEGFHVNIRLQPIVPPFIEEIKNELIPSIGDSGCQHITTEFLKIPVEKNVSMFNEIINTLGWNGYEYYKRFGSKAIGREWILPNRIIWDTIQQIIQVVKKYKMTHSNADYGLTHLGDTGCCCGIDKRKGFLNWFKGNFSYVIRQCNSDYITFNKVLDYWRPNGSIREVLNSQCRKKDERNLTNYLKKKWNSPGTVNAPDTFLGVSYCNKTDKNGDCVYFKEEIS